MSNSSNDIITIKELRKTFTQGKENINILNDVNCQIKTGEIISLIGESGCGKSTFLQIIGGLLNFDSGEVIINNKNLNKLNDNDKTNLRRNNIGFIYQQHHLLSDFTALENIKIAAKIAGKNDATATKIANDLLENLDLSNRANHRPAELSGGQQQRVAIARAFANQPEIILADEPTGNLDQKNSDLAINLFIEMSKQHNTTLVIATHNQEISKKTDKIYEINSGLVNLV